MEGHEYKKLHAEWYELASADRDHSREIAFWEDCIAAAGEPVLEIGSGTGRVLVPLLERGHNVTGIYTSEDMTAWCLARCAAKGLRGDIHDQDARNFSLSRQFALVIFPSGGLGLFVDDADIHSTFQRVRAHLKPGGWFVYEFEQAPAETAKGTSDSFTSDWFAAGDVIINWRRKHKYNPASRTWKQLMVYEKFVDGRLVGTEVSDRIGRMFTVEEVCRFAEAGGFVDIHATRWLTDDPPDRDTHVVTVRCRKPREGLL